MIYIPTWQVMWWYVTFDMFFPLGWLSMASGMVGDTSRSLHGGSPLLAECVGVPILTPFCWLLHVYIIRISGKFLLYYVKPSVAIFLTHCDSNTNTIEDVGKKQHFTVKRRRTQKVYRVGFYWTGFRVKALHWQELC